MPEKMRPKPDRIVTSLNAIERFIRQPLYRDGSLRSNVHIFITGNTTDIAGDCQTDVKS